MKIIKQRNGYVKLNSNKLKNGLLKGGNISNIQDLKKELTKLVIEPKKRNYIKF